MVQCALCQVALTPCASAESGRGGNCALQVAICNSVRVTVKEGTVCKSDCVRGNSVRVTGGKKDQ